LASAHAWSVALEPSEVIENENLAALLRFLESGEVKVVIDQIYPLGQVASAVAHVLEHRASGKVAITV
jgi:NADPH:quinone reductase-like Zn-dependent oxidoreductase